MRKSFYRRAWIAALVAGTAGYAFGIGVASPQLLARLDGDYLHVSLPHLDFLQGKPMDRLKDGATVAFLGQITISTAPNSVAPAARSVARFAFSYDIWEERFSVTKIGQTPESRHSISHLSAQAAQNWCIENLALDRSQLPADRDFWVQLDLRAEDPRDTLGIIGDPGINITRLIEIFGRPAHSAQPRWLLNSGPYHLEGVRKSDLKGPRG